MKFRVNINLEVDGDLTAGEVSEMIQFDLDDEFMKIETILVQVIKG